MPPKTKITQETFDEAVRSNVEDFDMEPEEALSSAIEEFTMKGCDLSSIIKTVQGGNTAGHPVAKAVQELKRQLEQVPNGDSLEPVANALEQLSSLVTIKDKEELQQNLAVALKDEAVPVLVTTCQELMPISSNLLVKSLQVLRRLMQTPDLREALLKAYGPELLLRILRDCNDGAVLTAVAAAAEAASIKEEDNKCRFMDLGFAELLLQRLGEEALPLDLVLPACGCLRSFTSADDERPTACKAFLHARLLAKTHGALKVLLAVLRRTGAERPDVCAALLAAVKQVAANEEICREFSDDGGVLACLELLRAAGGNVEVARWGCGALRQLANSDGVKELLAENGALDTIASLAQRYLAPQALQPEVLEAALGLIVNMTLRMPKVAAAAADAGCADVLLAALSSEEPGLAAVQRQACMAVRNMSVRNPELRPLFLGKGAEVLLRRTKKLHSRECKDVGSAALRDLGLDNYND